jgi:ketosteroid isomerase-like protein
MGKSSHRWIERSFRVGAALVVLTLLIRPLAAAPEDEVRATFSHFVAAQNGHDAKAVQALLLDSPDFLWITRGTPVWGVDAAMKRFATLYQGTWHLDPEAASLKVIMIGDGTAQLYVPIVFTIGPSGQSAQSTRFLMNQLLVKTATGWKISNILPIPAPAQ